MPWMSVRERLQYFGKFVCRTCGGVTVAAVIRVVALAVVAAVVATDGAAKEDEIGSNGVPQGVVEGSFVANAVLMTA